MDEKNPLEFVSEVSELMELHEYMKDDDLMKALDKALKLIVKPVVPDATVAPLIVQLQAYSTKFHLMYVTNMTFLKNTENAAHKKNVYRSTYEALDKLVDALKILARYRYA